MCHRSYCRSLFFFFSTFLLCSAQATHDRLFCSFLPLSAFFWTIAAYERGTPRMDKFHRFFSHGGRSFSQSGSFMQRLAKQRCRLVLTTEHGVYACRCFPQFVVNMCMFAWYFSCASPFDPTTTYDNIFPNTHDT